MKNNDKALSKKFGQFKTIKIILMSSLVNSAKRQKFIFFACIYFSNLSFQTSYEQVEMKIQ